MNLSTTSFLQGASVSPDFNSETALTRDITLKMSADESTPEVEKKEVEEVAEGVSGLVLESFSFTTAAAIIGYVDRKVCATLTDGRHLFGVLRTFDQYGSIVMQDTVERIYLPESRYAEDYIGDLLIRGENLLLVGDVDIDKEEAPLEKLQRIPFDEAKKLQRAEKKSAIESHKKKGEALHKFGLVSEGFVTA